MPFRRQVLAALVGAAMAGAAPAADTTSVPKPSEQTSRAEGETNNADCRSFMERFRKVAPSPSFATMPEPQRAQGYLLASRCSVSLKDYKASYGYALQGSALKGADPLLWRQRLYFELNEKQWAEAVTTVEVMAARDPTALNRIPIVWLGSLNQNVQLDRDLTRRLLKPLSDPAYQPEEPLADGDGFKLRYAAILAGEGDKAGAAALVARIGNPGVLVRISVDSRLRTQLPADFDGRAAVERWLARAREIAASHPGSLASMVQISQYLRLLGRPGEALATLEAASPEGAQARTFTDLDERRNWWWDGLARTYKILGRADEALAAFRKGSGITENGNINVSQALNLANAEFELDRPADALATLSTFEQSKAVTSPYGEMVLRQVRGCARLALGQRDAAKADIAYAAEHERDNGSAYMDLLICANDIAAAAAALVRRLDDPDRRIDALLSLSDYDPDPPTSPKAPFAGWEAKLKARPEVQAAIVRAGGTRRFHLQSAEI